MPGPSNAGISWILTRNSVTDRNTTQGIIDRDNSMMVSFMSASSVDDYALTVVGTMLTIANRRMIVSFHWLGHVVPLGLASMGHCALIGNT